MAMKILVFSDSHGNYDNLERAYEKEQPDVMLHLGDGEADFSRLKQHAQLPQPAVFGETAIWEAAAT